MNLKFVCGDCGKTYSIDTLSYKCNKCDGLYHLEGQAGKISTEISLGEVETPVIKRNLAGHSVYFKLDYFQPTGSFKDRGAVVLIDQLARQGIKEIVEDSSGNAGAAIAAYAAAAGIDCSIYLPADTSKGKIKQIKSYGAEIVKIEGERDAVAEAVKNAADKKYYASHVYNPLFFAGTSSLAFEISNNPGIPDKIFVPVGNGTMLLGLYYGFKMIGYMPQLIGVQSENCSPIYNYYYNKNSKCNKTAAEGIAVGSPVRKKEIIKAVKESNGDIITVSEKKIKKVLIKIHKMGIFIETTSAVAPAGFLKYLEKGNISEEETIILPLTGSGLKK